MAKSIHNSYSSLFFGRRSSTDLKRVSASAVLSVMSSSPTLSRAAASCSGDLAAISASTFAMASGIRSRSARILPRVSSNSSLDGSAACFWSKASRSAVRAFIISWNASRLLMVGSFSSYCFCNASYSWFRVAAVSAGAAPSAAVPSSRVTMINKCFMRSTSSWNVPNRPGRRAQKTIYVISDSKFK